MAKSFKDDLRDVLTGLSSSRSSSPSKSAAYSTLLHLQQLSSTSSADPVLITLLADSSSSLLQSILVDIFDRDEEMISVQALKCLGFMIYHPSILASIKCEDSSFIVESLVKVITTTKIKWVCNLGLWCISMQQFTTTLLDTHFHALLRAISYGLANPMGSLSITFEAMLAVMKLAGSMGEKMRNSSNIWVPPLYRRLASDDKREKEMSERCLLKVKTIICPPPIALSKMVILDMKKKLLAEIEEMVNRGKKIEALKAWGWFIRLLGPYMTKHKDLVNELLKLPTRTFSDFDPQVQIASLVSWEGLIEALICPPFNDPESSSATRNASKDMKIYEGDCKKMISNGFSKKLKLIMTPLAGIMTSRCDVSVHVACLSTWCYLLHKLDTSVSHDSVVRIACQPILEAVFQTGPKDFNRYSWNFCIELLDNFILTRSGQNESINVHVGADLSPIKWSPWDLTQLDFFVNTIHYLFNQGSDPVRHEELVTLTYNAASRLFRSLLRSVQNSLRCELVTYDEVMLCLNVILKFFIEILENSSSDDTLSLQLLCAAMEELDPSILEYPLYKVALDIKVLENVQPICRNLKTSDIGSLAYMEMVSPAVYISVLYFVTVIKSPLVVTPEMYKYLKLIVSSYDKVEILKMLVGLLYTHKESNCFEIWVTLAKCLNEFVMEDGSGYSAVMLLLNYPFAAYPILQGQFEITRAIEAWELFYDYISKCSQICHLIITRDVFEMLNGNIDENSERGNFLMLLGNAMSCVLEKAINDKHNNKDGDSGSSNNVMSSLEFAFRFMKIPWVVEEKNLQISFSIASRLLSKLVNFIGCFPFHQGFISFIEITTKPLLLWLSHMDLQDNCFKDQLPLLWSEILKNLQKNQLVINFDSSFLKLQSPLLQKTLDHPCPEISNPSVQFWDSTYGKQVNLQYPENLLRILDKLLRNGRLTLCRKTSPGKMVWKISSASSLNRCSKRVEFAGVVGGKRARGELTEHQKEVRRAQQGRGSDALGRGPGIRTYTSVDFTQDNNEESQESQDIRDADSIMEMVRKIQ
ncbi:hypothetical protein DM860_016439 [Cuscuta australis]|uniref:Telomere-associated protein Rif1 N-terminal domain-containing protein n=1 Tax=Cuscuta australis TaxID=267555 RepID=A0A328DJE3_9ASTE|nr:hypothetical protein DM860_016439 [Cuscuta australis]